jgi:uncharacterized protein YijF (DUF1287 family)
MSSPLALLLFALLPAAAAHPAATPHPRLSFPDAGEAGRLLEAVRIYVRQGVRYDASYVELAYPGGEPPAGRGACTDLVAAGLRGIGIDLQRAVHEDIGRAPAEYLPTLAHYGSASPDPSIDHRRVANLEVYFRRHLLALPPALETAGWLPGDLVVWDQNRDSWGDHVGIVAEERAPAGHPLVHHNYPRRGHHPGVAHAGDCLREWRIVGHYRLGAGSPPVTQPKILRPRPAPSR